jgi:hypothetical protein
MTISDSVVGEKDAAKKGKAKAEMEAEQARKRQSEKTRKDIERRRAKGKTTSYS